MFINPKVDIDGDRYYSYILCYVNDILVVHHDDIKMLNNIFEYFKLNLESIGDPDTYLVANIYYHTTKNGV